MKQRPVILVIGATGAQGGSVAQALLKAGKFAVRVLTRNKFSAAAKTLAAAGAEVVAGNLNNMESLLMAMKNCYGVFGVTNYWEHYEDEYQLGKNLIDAVHQSGIQHFVFSTQPGYQQLSKESLAVPHCDIKAQLQAYTKQLQLPATFVQVSFYYENFLQLIPLRHGQGNTLYFGLPLGNTKLSMVSVKDLGGVVEPIFDYPEEFVGRVVGIVGEDRSCAEYATILSKVLGRTIVYVAQTREEFAGSGIKGATAWANQLEVQRRLVTNRRVQLIETYGLNPGTQSFESWLQQNKESFNALLQGKAVRMNPLDSAGGSPFAKAS